MIKLKSKKKWIASLLCGILVYPLVSCSESEVAEAKYDPNKPIVCTSFSPTGGPISTQVILTGQNFGTNASLVKAYFNQKEAPVIGVNDEHMLVLAPRLPGEDVVIKIMIGTVTEKETGNDTIYQSASFDGYFDYEIQTNISTVCGGDASATTDPTGTIALAEAQFAHEINNNIEVDKGGNIFFGFNGDNSDHLRYVASPKADRLKLIDNPGVFLTVPGICYDPYKDRVYHIQSNIGNNEYWWYDVNNDFVQMDKGEISWDDNDFIPSGMASWAARRAAAMNPEDGMFYTRSYGGYMERFDPEAGLGENLTMKLGGVGVGSTSGSTYGMVFDLDNPKILYFTNDELDCIFKTDLSTGRTSIFAGQSNISGYLDGPLTTAQFSEPHQMCRDSEGNLYVADSGNHCIRKINMKTGFVSTVAGIPQSGGYLNGTSESAKFNYPLGLCIDTDDILYVGDQKNHAIRRVAIE